MDDDSDQSRQVQELEALQAVYGDEVVEVIPNTSSWKIQVASNVVLELKLPHDYPSRNPPTPTLRAKPWILGDSQIGDLTQDMLDLWDADMEIAIVWAEYCRTALEEQQQQINADGDRSDDQHHGDDDDDDDDDANNPQEPGIQQPQHAAESATADTRDATQTFQPPTSRYGQPTRHFQTSIIHDDAYRREIHHGSPFHPPKSGPSETMIAHVASVTCMQHVQWVLADLLFNDKKVAKAAHNMIAYRFHDAERNCMVSDNDDDGEKGSGMKLAALLEMSNAENVIVVVSRWFGGVLLGPSRFKHIATTARDALVEAGHIVKNRHEKGSASGGSGGGSAGNAKGSKRGGGKR